MRRMLESWSLCLTEPKKVLKISALDPKSLSSTQACFAITPALSNENGANIRRIVCACETSEQRRTWTRNLALAAKIGDASVLEGAQGARGKRRTVLCIPVPGSGR